MKVNFFGSDSYYNRFGMAWQCGVKVAVKNFVVGIGYEDHLTNLSKVECDRSYISQVNISLGIRF